MKRSIRCFFLSTLILLVWVAADAQTRVSGMIVDEADDAIIGAAVIARGSSIGTVTDFDGTFELLVPEGISELEISYLGFLTQIIDINETVSPMSITLEEDVNNLDEVIVTGLASNVKRSNSGNAVASISAAELTGVTTQATMDGALYGKFTGADLRSNSGAPGGGMSVRLRGVTSIFGDQNPLYIVDGIYIDNSSVSLGTNIVSEAAGGGNTATNQDDASNRIADIDPEDIESVEVLKGASAAAIYGSRAAGGVVIITTKRGANGKTSVGFSQTVGISTPITLLGTRDWDAAKVESVYGADEAARFRQNPFTDYEKELYDNPALSSTSRLEVSGGNEKTAFFLGGTIKNDDGLVDNTGYGKKSLRLNISQKLTDWLKVDATSNYIDSKADRGFFNNGNTNTTVGYALAFSRPWDILQADADGVYPANPRVGSNVLETVALVTNRERTRRFIGGATIDARLFSTDKQNLKLVLRGGMDQYTLRNEGIFPQTLSFYRDPNSYRGVLINGSTVNLNTNLAAFLVHSYFLDSGLSFRTQAGVTQEDFDFDRVTTTSTGLIGSQTNVDQADNISVSQFRRPQRDKGFFVQEEVNFNDKIIFTVGLRGDKSTNNGDSDKLYFYPKANVAFNLSNLGLIQSETFDLVKIRAAYGQSGRFSNFNDRFNLYDATFIGNGSGVITSTLRGNSDVGPERQSELEFGTDIVFLNNRIGFEANYYIKTIEDLLLQAQVPTSSGYVRRVINGGELRNNGIELSLSASPVRGAFEWNTELRWWKNTSEVTKLAVPAFNLGGFAASLGQYRIQEGKSATQIVGTFNPEDCQSGDCSDLDPDGDGMRVYGDAEADFNMSFNNSLSYKGFDFNMNWHWKQGGDAVNLSTLLYDLGNTTWDYDEKTLDPSGEQVNGDYRKSEWFAGNASPWIEDAGYIRLREVSLFYSLPSSLFNDVARIKIGISGRNLVNIFDYNSYDPEVSNFGSNVLANSIEVTPFPSAKTINFHLKAKF